MKTKRDINSWDYFKIIDDVQKKAECLICHGSYSFYATSNNLKCHIESKHTDVIKENYDSYILSEVKERALSGVISRHFTKIGGKYRCKYCHMQWNNTTIIKLRTHLKRKHQNVFYDCLATEQDNIQIEEVENSDLDTSVKFSSEVWRQFEHNDDNDETKCSLCQMTLTNNIEDMKNHLEEHHTELLDEILAKAQKGLNDSEDENEDASNDNGNELDESDVYTEVVYLEDEPKPNKNIARQARRKRSISRPRESILRNKIKKERNISVSSEELAPQPKESVPNELKLFVNYITCLLQKVPAEASQKLQFDIISLIMNAQKINQQQTVELTDSDKRNTAPGPSALDKSVLMMQNGTGVGNPNTFNVQRVITVPMNHLISQNNERMIAVPMTQFISNVSETTKNDNVCTSTNTSTVSMPALSTVSK